MRRFRRHVIGFAVLLAILTAAILCLSGCRAAGEEEVHPYISDGEEFIKALQAGEQTIYVGDIAFDSQKEISINYPVKIIGREEKSTLENVHFIVAGTNVAGKEIEITFQNIICDGKVNQSELRLEEGKTFDELFGETPQYACFDGCAGYYTLNIDRCEIRNYLCETGPAVYIDNDTKYREGQKTLNLTNSKIYGNVSNAGTVKVFSDVLTTNIDNCEFYGNLARAGQGIAVGNGKSSITNTSIHDNGFFRFVNPMEKKLPAIFHDDRQTFKGVTTNALGGCCGALFIGGSHTTVDSCRIYNNKTIFGGGIGIVNAATLEADEKIEVRNTEIFGNEALLCGGALYVESNQGETTFFVNCLITGNKAEEGSVLYATTYAPDDDTKYAGNIRFAFCTMAENTANDTQTFRFYELLKPELAGVISLKGCFVLDSADYAENGEEYNYIAAADQAIADQVISEDDLADLRDDYASGISPKKESKADRSVPAAEYARWAQIDSGASEERSIGYLPAEDGNSHFPYWILISALSVIGVTAVVLAVFSERKRSKASRTAEAVPAENLPEGSEQDESSSENAAEPTVDYSAYSYDDVCERVKKVYGETLTKKEVAVASYLLFGKSRREIAEKLFISEETVKTHVSNIFKKLGVSSKGELKRTAEKAVFAEQTVRQ